MIKNNRIVMTSIIASSIMLMGCNNKNVDTKVENGKTETSANKDVAQSKELVQIDLLKTGVKFNEVHYATEDYSFSVGVSQDIDLSKQELRINLDNLNVDNKDFCEEVKTAVKSLGGTDADYEKIIETLKGYVKESETTENKNDFHLSDELNLNENTLVELSLLMYEDTKNISVVFIADDCAKYLENTNLKFNSTSYENEDTQVEVEQSLHEDGSFAISIGAPLSKKDDVEFKEYLETAFNCFSVSNEDIKKVNDNIASGKLGGDEETIESNDYIIYTYLYEEDDKFSIEIIRF